MLYLSELPLTVFVELAGSRPQDLLSVNWFAMNQWHRFKCQSLPNIAITPTSESTELVVYGGNASWPVGNCVCLSFYDLTTQWLRVLLGSGTKAAVGTPSMGLTLVQCA